MKDLTKKLNLEDNVLFLGEVSHKDLPQYLWISDVFVRPSLSEGLGNAFLEAMAAGVPVIGTKVGGIPDFLREGETGLFCEVQNPKSIAEKIETLLKDKKLRLRLVENGRKLVEEKYNWDSIARQIENIFKKLT
ncbi:MAG: Glycosyl transferase group 1 [Candidatus Azambacteria bacterium GW2011_GWF2_46_32]|uniref:Glycosyl transferase group 1 n=1 Tax=Candidatus Azambacteria bacterium GW2011_GWF2_46_32 TaxID=1618628 RepID=A0A0G1PUY9_9BACT|nr:MAG: Glycosyl transferase group 1 [Candidatus Azambacteria bacterium GW2011_GWF2_46_32]